MPPLHIDSVEPPPQRPDFELTQTQPHPQPFKTDSNTVTVFFLFRLFPVSRPPCLYSCFGQEGSTVSPRPQTLFVGRQSDLDVRRCAVNYNPRNTFLCLCARSHIAIFTFSRCCSPARLAAFCLIRGRVRSTAGSGEGGLSRTHSAERVTIRICHGAASGGAASSF